MIVRRSFFLILAGLAFLSFSPLSVFHSARTEASDQEVENRPDEPLRETFSLEAALEALDDEALRWGRENTCLSCHASYSLLMVRSMVSTAGPAEQAVLEAARNLAVHPRESTFMPAEAVMVASVLAMYDSRTSGVLDSSTRLALARMWESQRDDGGWDWIHNNKPPSEIDDDYGVTMAALGVGLAPGGYAETPRARKGLQRIRSYLRENPPVNLHNRAMRLLASLHVSGIMDRASRDETVEALFASQQPDGGWGLATLGRNWKRADGSPQNFATSDGYGTGFVIYVLRAAGVPAQDPRIQKGINWLKGNQRASGRWFTPSMEKDEKHYVSNPGTAFSVMALRACGESVNGPAALQSVD